MTLPQTTGPQSGISPHPDELDPASISSARSIFRSVALEKYVRNQEKVVLPPMVSPANFIYLWIVAGIVMVVGLLLVFWPWAAPLVMRTP